MSNSFCSAKENQKFPKKLPNNLSLMNKEHHTQKIT